MNKLVKNAQEATQDIQDDMTLIMQAWTTSAWVYCYKRSKSRK